MWMLENLIDLSETEEELPFFEDGCPTSQLMLLPHQRAQASLSTRAGGFGLSSAEARRMSASVGSMVATIPEVLADLSGKEDGWVAHGATMRQAEEEDRV